MTNLCIKDINRISNFKSVRVALGFPEPAPKSAFKVNLSARGLPPIPSVTPTPIISPSNPSTVVIKSTSSLFKDGEGAITLWWFCLCVSKSRISNRNCI